MVDLESRLARISSIDRGKRRKKITVLGAGIAGLVAGYELKSLGHHVRLFEGSERVGGRVHTHRFSDDTHGELGAMRIPKHHHYTRHYVNKMGLHLRRFVTSHENLECFYDIHGKITRMKDAQVNLYGQFDLSREQRQLPIPPAIFSQARDQLVKSLTDAERAELLSRSTASERILDLDKLSLRDFLYKQVGRGGGDLVGLATGMEAALDRGLTMFLYEAVAIPQVGFDEIVEGMDALPKALSKSLADDITFGTEVLGLRRSEKGISLLLKRHTQFEEFFEEPVICTLPFTILRSLPHGLRLSTKKEKVIRQLGYMSSTKVLLHSVDRFWEKNYGICGGASQTDTLIRAVYYPSDFVEVVDNSQPLGHYNGYGLYSAYRGGRFRSIAEANASGVLLGSYTWGADARRMGALSRMSRKDVTIEDISRFHPEIREPGMIDDHASIFWDNTPWMRGGTYSYLEPCQRFEMISEGSKNEGNLYFAGEHCSFDNAWIQGAIISAIDAVEAIVALP